MEKELKRAILIWLTDNENQWQRVNSCHEQFKRYIYDENGNYIIGGAKVSNFIDKADKLIYGELVYGKVISD